MVIYCIAKLDGKLEKRRSWRSCCHLELALLALGLVWSTMQAVNVKIR